MQQAGPPAPARPREKSLIRIEDPNTGKDLTEELFNNANQGQQEPQEQDDEAQRNPRQEICMLFTQKVAAALRDSPEDSAQPQPSQAPQATPIEGQAAAGMPPGAPQVGPPSGQQYQQPPPVPVTQQPPGPPPAHLMRPAGMPTNMGPPRMPPPMMPPRPPRTMQPQGQPQPSGAMNLNRPPPHILRQPTPAHVYNSAQQMHVRHPQPGVPQNMPRQSSIPVMAPPASQVARVQPPHPQQQPQQPPPNVPEAPAPPVQPHPPAPEVEQPAQAEVAETAGQSEIAAAAEMSSVPAKEKTPPVEEAAVVTPDTTPAPEDAAVATEGKDEPSQGATNKGPKDGRSKSKQKKRELNNKEIGGSDMDAFIDKPHGSQVCRKDALPSYLGKPSAVKDAIPAASTGTGTGHLKRDPKNPWNLHRFQQVQNSPCSNSLEPCQEKTQSSLIAPVVLKENSELKKPEGNQNYSCGENSKKALSKVKLVENGKETPSKINSIENGIETWSKVSVENGKETVSKVKSVGPVFKMIKEPTDIQAQTKFNISISSDEKESASKESNSDPGTCFSLESSLTEHCQRELHLLEVETQAFNTREIMPPPPSNLMIHSVPKKHSALLKITFKANAPPVSKAKKGAGEGFDPTGMVAQENASLNNASTATSQVSSGSDVVPSNTNLPAVTDGSSESSSTSSSSPCENEASKVAKSPDAEVSDLEGKPVKEEPKQQVHQQDSKHKIKKKKKKKGRKSPPLPKCKGAMSNCPAEEKENETSRPASSSPLTITPAAAEGNPSEEVTAPQTVADSQDTAAPVTPAEDAQEKSTEAPSPDAGSVQPTETKVEEASPSSPADPVAEQQTDVVVETSGEEKADVPPVPSTQNQNQPNTGDSNMAKVTDSEESHNAPNGVKPEHAAKSQDLPPSETIASPQTPVNDENTPPQSSQDPARVTPSRDDDDVPAKAPSDKQELKKGKDKLQYDRSYLMELRECASSQTKPEGLPNLEIILDRPMTRGAGTGPDFTPGFFQPSTPQRHPQQMGKSASRGRGRPGEMQMPQRVIKSVSIQNDVKALHQSEKPWKPSQKQLATGEIVTKSENLESRALFIMNRLTPTNFEPLSAEMMSLTVNDYEKLQQLVKIIFDKVTLETKFVEAYAQLCKKMCSLKVPPPPGLKENQATFRVLLLTKCQTEFESDKTIVFEDPEEKRKKLEAEMPDAPDKKDQIETKLYHMKLRRLKFYGNIRFIGELFKLGMLTENIMHDCIYRLLKARDDESLLSLCQLVTTVGQILDTEKAKSRMDQYFTQMTKIAEERKSRIKFTLKDAIELRLNHWVPRKEQTGPKKIDEVRQDFQQEQQTKQYLQSQPLPPRNDPQPVSRRGSRQRQEEKPNDDGWNTVGAKSIKLDASKMKLSRQNVVDDNIQLGPGGGMSKFSMWSRGSGASQPPQDSPASRPSNRYSALTSDDDRRFQRSPSRGDGGVPSRGLRQSNTAGHGRGKISGRSSMEGERRDALASARSIVGGRSQNSSRDNSWNRDDRRSFGPRSSREGENPLGPPRLSLRPSAERASAPPAPIAPKVVPGYGTVKKAAPKTEEEMEHSAKTIMDEYLNIRDLKEAKVCVMELEGQKYLHSFITASINNVLERSDSDRINTGQFFYEILKDNLISLDKFVKGLSAVIEFAEDMVIDIPKMWTNLAQLITPTLVGACMPWSQLKPTLDPYLSPMCSAKLLAEILLFAKGVTSESEVSRMWQTSGLAWEQFLPANRVDDFIKDKKLEFLQSPASTPDQPSSARTTPASAVNQGKVTEDLVRVIRDDARPNAEIIAFIKDTVPRNLEEKAFVRLLMTAVCKASLSENLKPKREVITKRQELLQNYIKTPDLELQALYAIQALMHQLEHPSGAITTLFESLYSEEVINEEAFKAWEVSTDEQEGKGACSLQLTQFFAWLRENEDIETS